MASRPYTEPVTCWGCGRKIHNPREGQMFHNHKCANKSELLIARTHNQPLGGKKGQRWAQA